MAKKNRCVGLFAYELCAARGNEIAAIASISVIIPVKTDRSKLKPMPIFHVAGRYDPLVRFEWQNESIDFIKARNQIIRGVPHCSLRTLISMPFSPARSLVKSPASVDPK